MFELAAQHDGRAHLRVPGRHVQEGAPPRPGRARHHPQRPGLLAALAARAADCEKVDWRPGSMVVPPNTGSTSTSTPAPSRRATWRCAGAAAATTWAGRSRPARATRTSREGRAARQIEYEDEDRAHPPDLRGRDGGARRHAMNRCRDAAAVGAGRRRHPSPACGGEGEQRVARRRAGRDHGRADAATHTHGGSHAPRPRAGTPTTSRHDDGVTSSTTTATSAS